MLLNLTFSLRTNQKTNEPQYQAFSHDRKVMYVAHRNGPQPAAGHIHWMAETVFTAYRDNAGKSIVVVKLVDEVQKPGTSARALRRKGIDPEKFRAEQEAQRMIARTGVTPKNGVIQISERTLRQAAVN